MSATDSACPKTLIPSRVPEPFLRAEIAAFPLASEESFLAGLVELDPKFGEGNKSGGLWRACEARLAPHTGWSLDRLVAERDRGWFGPQPRSGRQAVPLHEYLHTLACSYLAPRAGVTEIRESTDLTALDAADHYRWLTFTLPEDLLLAALGVDPAPVRVDLDPPLLVRRLLDLGVAEIHQHIGAGMDFPLIWGSALAAIATVDVAEGALAGPGAPLAEGKNLVRWLLVAAISRCLLAEFLIKGGESFHSFVRGACFSKERAAWTPRRRETLSDALGALIAGDERRLPGIEPLRDLYADLHPTALTLRDHPLQSIDDAFQRCDPISVRLQLRGRNAGERWFLRKGFAYLRDRRRGAKLAAGTAPDDYFSRVFWQTVRVRCQYYRTIVQRPLTGGLQWFIRFYERLGNLRAPLNPIRPQVSYSVAGERHRIRALEFRTSLGNSAIDVGEELLDFLSSWRRVLHETSGPMFEPEMGIVYHFVKERDERDKSGWSKGRPGAFWADTCADPHKEGGMDVLHGRYVNYFAKQCGKARALAELIEAVPSSLWVIRGLDVASDELGVPTWVLAPLFRHLQDFSATVSIRERDGAGPPLYVTAHAGEDFLHLMQGLRRIYEQIHYVLGGTKGRLGHAVALGVEPRAWAESTGSVLMPAEERLWDLVFEWRLYTRYKIKPECAATAPAGRVEFLLNAVRDLSDLVYGKFACRIEELAEAHHMLHIFLAPPYVRNLDMLGGYSSFLDAARNIRWNNEQEPTRFARRVGEIVKAYLDNESIFRRGQTLIDVPVRSDEVEALDAAQRALRRGVAHRGIVIEVNPSSNLLIGDFRDLRSHPILRLHPPVPDPDSPPSVAIALGSDDPITFNSELLKEYILLHQAACGAGYPERVVQEWLEMIRRTGMDARFTQAWRPSAKEKIEKLIDDMRNYLHEPEQWRSRSARCGRVLRRG